MCDDVLEALNTISFLGDEHHQTRIMLLRHSLTHTNNDQGLCFVVVGTVIDRRVLAKVALGMAGSAVSVVTALVAIGTHGIGNVAGSTAD